MSGIEVGRQPNMESDKAKGAVILLSGGLDSATTLAIARADGWLCHALSLDYGQRHRAELDAASRLAVALGAAEQRVVRIGLDALGGSALTDAAIAVPETSDEAIPATYVPARNTIFLAIALACAETVGATDLFIGVNSVDYSGYPDCRPEFIDAFARLANVATRAGVEGGRFHVQAPLLRMSKAEIIRRGTQLGVDYSLTVSCYQADERGRACARCDACHLRREGFRTAGMADPTRYQARASRALG
ncbi:MAG TPA: 7-cyano-7-deazaguanine synthase QueC [Gammaproteobacteria bacterium]|nr:7-cyano-7-deazaguanine synthase QueC [Gammaproteobacteria bacterium]